MKEMRLLVQGKGGGLGEKTTRKNAGQRKKEKGRRTIMYHGKRKRRGNESP